MNINRFAIATLSSHPHYYDEVLKLIENEFHYSEEHHFDIDFAPLLNPLNFHHCYIVIDTEKNELAAHLACNKRVMIKNKFELPVLFIGGIVTKKEYRGENLFRSLMNHCLEKNSDTGLFFLWSEIEGLYEKFNFFRAGAVIETGKNVITKENIPDGFVKSHFSQLTLQEFEQIKIAHQKNIQNKFFTVKRTDTNWEIIRAMTSIDLYIKRNSNHEIVEYFAYGKGKDIPCIIHELASSEINLTLNTLSAYKLWLPENFLTEFPNHSLQYLSYVRLGNQQTLNKFFKDITAEQLKINALEKGEVVFEFNSKTFHSLEKEFLHYLFGPTPLEEFKSFELYPYIPGTDSV